MAILIQLARQAAQRVLGGAGRRALVGGGVGGVAGQQLAEGDGFLGGLFGGAGADGAPRRRRRRKALTSDDIKIALTIASAISKKAAENFILSRTRSA